MLVSAGSHIAAVWCLAGGVWLLPLQLPAVAAASAFAAASAVAAAAASAAAAAVVAAAAASAAAAAVAAAVAAAAEGSAAAVAGAASCLKSQEMVSSVSAQWDAHRCARLRGFLPSLVLQKG